MKGAGYQDTRNHDFAAVVNSVIGHNSDLQWKDRVVHKAPNVAVLLCLLTWSLLTGS